MQSHFVGTCPKCKQETLEQRSTIDDLNREAVTIVCSIVCTNCDYVPTAQEKGRLLEKKRLEDEKKRGG